MKTLNFELGILQKTFSRLSFIGFLIITLIQSIQINSNIEKNIFSNSIDIAEVIILFYIIIVNITIMIKLKKIVSKIIF